MTRAHIVSGWVAIASLGPLAVALVAQYGWGLRPCHFCLLARVPYLFPAVAFALLCVTRHAMWRKLWVALAVLGWLLSAAISTAHVGIEQHWWRSGESGCSLLGSRISDDLQALRARILSGTLVACDQPAAEFLGLSMAAWNVVAALSAGGIAIALFRRYG